MDETPRFVIAALVFIQHEDAILLVKQAYGRRCWSLPGGVVEYGESVDQAAIREVKEETGLDIRLRRVVGIYSKPEEHSLAITFEGEVVGDELVAQHEISDCQYFNFDDLPAAREHFYQRVEDFRQPRAEVILRTQ